MTLMLHAGANPVKYDALRALPVPEVTAKPHEFAEIAAPMVIALWQQKKGMKPDAAAEEGDEA